MPPRIVQVFLAGFLMSSVSLSAAQATTTQSSEHPASADSDLLHRHYHEGEKLAYHMKGSNRGNSGTQLYEVEATGVVKKDAAGKFVEEYAWSNLIVNGAPVALSPAATNFRQTVSLDSFQGVPDLSQ